MPDFYVIFGKICRLNNFSRDFGGKRPPAPISCAYGDEFMHWV